MENTLVSSAEQPIKLSSNRSFGFLFSAFFYLIGILPLWHHHPIRSWGLLVGSCFLIAACLCPHLLRPLNRLWLQFSLLLGKVTTPIIMGIIFYLVLTPISICRRLFKSPPLALHFEPMQKTYWVKRPSSGFDAKNMKNQF